MAETPTPHPVGYWKVIQVSGYKHRSGKWVSGYLRSIWLVSFPVPKKDLDLTDFGREKFPRREAPPPPRVLAPESPASSWTPVEDYILDLYDEYEYFEIQDPIFRKDPGAGAVVGDFINSLDGLVWERKLRERTMREARIQEIYLVRVWILLYNRNKDEHFVFARSRSLLMAPEASRLSLRGAYKQCLEIYDDILKWTQDHTDYIEVRRLLGWTCWGTPRGEPDYSNRELAPKRPADGI